MLESVGRDFIVVVLSGHHMLLESQIAKCEWSSCRKGCDCPAFGGFFGLRFLEEQTHLAICDSHSGSGRSRFRLTKEGIVRRHGLFKNWLNLKTCLVQLIN